MLSIIFGGIFIIFFIQRACNILIPFKMRIIYINLGLYCLNVYSWLYVNFFRTIEYFKMFSYKTKHSDQKSKIIFCQNGNEIKECDLEQLNSNLELFYNCDVILYKKYCKEENNYSVARITKDNIIDELAIIPDIEKSNIKFLNISISYNNEKYNIEFEKDNYYLCGNIILDKAFIKWYVNRAYGVIFDDNIDNTYVCNIMDHNIEMIELLSDQQILIEKDGYKIEKSNRYIDCSENSDLNNSSIEEHLSMNTHKDFFSYLSCQQAISD